MQAISIVGYKSSGKTTLTALLADALEKKGRRVAIIKYTHHPLDKQHVDTSRLMRPHRTVVGLSPEESAVFWSAPRTAHSMLPLLDADVLLVEGGKQNGWLPRILCSKEHDDIMTLQPELALATWGYASLPTKPHIVENATSYEQSIEHLADIVVERAFMLPNLDCRACGYSSCLELSQRIVAGEEDSCSCRSMESTFSIEVDGRPLAMNPFVERIIAGALRGMLQELKGYTPNGTVHIRIPRNMLD